MSADHAPSPPTPPPASVVSRQVMDEADRILNMDFGVEVDKIVKAIPRERQTFLFSATMTKKVPCPSAGRGAAGRADWWERLAGRIN